MDKKGSFLIAFVLFSLAIFTITGLNLSAGGLSLSDSPDAVLALERRQEGLILRILDQHYLIPASLVENFEQGGARLHQMLRLTLPSIFRPCWGCVPLPGTPSPLKATS